MPSLIDLKQKLYVLTCNICLHVGSAPLCGPNSDLITYITMDMLKEMGWTSAPKPNEWRCIDCRRAWVRIEELQ